MCDNSAASVMLAFRREILKEQREAAERRRLKYSKEGRDCYKAITQERCKESGSFKGTEISQIKKQDLKNWDQRCVINTTRKNINCFKVVF